MNHARNKEVFIFKDSAALIKDAARRFVDISTSAISKRGKCIVALSGGSTPRALYELLAASPYSGQIQWSNIYFFFGDERFVGHDDKDSTYLMVKDALFSQVGIPQENIFPVPTEGITPEEAVLAYTKSIVTATGQSFPRFDLIFLGMGPDGHTASLFPGFPTLNSSDLVAVVKNSPKPPSVRLTFTFPLINNAENIIFMVTGADKVATLKAVLEGQPDMHRVPAQGVVPTNGKLIWLVDEKAGDLLARPTKPQ